MRRVKPQPRFTARLALLLPREKRILVSVASFRVLPESERLETHTCCYYTPPGGRQRMTTRRLYYKLLKLPPIDNPCIADLRRLLKRQRVLWTENVSGDYLEFSTINC